jgi:hypothetical protein
VFIGTNKEQSAIAAGAPLRKDHMTSFLHINGEWVASVPPKVPMLHTVRSQPPQLSRKGHRKAKILGLLGLHMVDSIHTQHQVRDRYPALDFPSRSCTIAARTRIDRRISGPCQGRPASGSRA